MGGFNSINPAQWYGSGILTESVGPVIIFRPDQSLYFQKKVNVP